MPSDPLREPLSELERELLLHGNSTEHYRELQKQTRRLLDTEQHDSSLLEDLRNQLQSALVLAEAQHPVLANGIMRVIDSLNSLGI